MRAPCSSVDGGTAAGDLLVAGGVLSPSLYTIVAKRFDDGSDALSLTTWRFTVATAVSLLVTIARWTAGSGIGTVSAAHRSWLAVVLVGAGGAAFVSSTPAGQRSPAFGIAQGGLSLGQGAAMIAAGGAAQHFSPGGVIAAGGLLGVLAAILITVTSRQARPG